jgi:histidine ammonia-lyase
MTVELSSRRDITLEALARVALGGEGVRIMPKAKAAMEAARRDFMAYLEADRGRFIYGVTSGPGQRATRRLTPAEQRRQAALHSRTPDGAGFGPEALPERVVRMIVVARLANYLDGHAKARTVEAERIARLLEAPMPRVPLSGQVGAGEILPLFHVMHHLPEGETEEGEPMARVNGAPVAAALLADVALSARKRLERAAQVFALSVEGYRAPLEPYDAALGRYLRGRAEREGFRVLRYWLSGASRGERLGHQAPVSWRILPQVLAAAARAVDDVERAARVSLASVTDNPVYLHPDEVHPLGRAISTGGFHNAQAAPAIDTVNARLADLCTLADRHCLALHSGGHLPESLAAPGSESWGTTLLSFVQVGYGEEARQAARRTFLPPSEGGGVGGQNDIAAPAMLAYQRHLRASFCLDACLALLAASASQALWVTGRQPAPRLRPFLAALRELVPPVVERGERHLGEELEHLRERLAAAADEGTRDLP